MIHLLFSRTGLDALGTSWNYLVNICVRLQPSFFTRISKYPQENKAFSSWFLSPLQSFKGSIVAQVHGVSPFLGFCSHLSHFGISQHKLLCLYPTYLCLILAFYVLPLCELVKVLRENKTGWICSYPLSGSLLS